MSNSHISGAIVVVEDGLMAGCVAVPSSVLAANTGRICISAFVYGTAAIFYNGRWLIANEVDYSNGEFGTEYEGDPGASQPDGELNIYIDTSGSDTMIICSERTGAASTPQSC